MKNNEKNTDAIDILHRRYIGESAERQASLEAERVHAQVAHTIYDLRKQQGLTQKELAKMIGTTQSVISRLEDADYEGHSLSMLSRIATALGQRLVFSVAPAAPGGGEAVIGQEELPASLKKNKLIYDHTDSGKSMSVEDKKVYSKGAKTRKEKK
ncbi:MAG: XRE family transcriptional regulator [Deltaproteobacteria bacterium]|nr:XRE family transcriptional regulator [Deltaproteobacteria bacterium]MBI4794570.1 XRE family transcriptional regulator [Deltaproteobacteria bacterium]